LGLAHAPDIQGYDAILAPKALAADRPEEMRAIPTPAIPPGQEGRFVRIEETAVAAMPRLALGKRRAPEIPLHGAPTEPDLSGNRIQGPALPMVRPDLLVASDPLYPPRGGAGHCPCGWLLGREQHGGATGGRGWAGGIVHGCWCRDVLGIDARQLWGVGPEDVGQHVREIL
jgi:hypothetical protein